ncbi:MAG: hypothetical protein ACK4M7_06000, partial [Burkholderiales bacterium]
INNFNTELPYWSYMLPKLPRTFANSLVPVEELKEQNRNYLKLLYSYRRQNQFFSILIIVLIIILLMKI